jgi:hypothetical protein
MECIICLEQKWVTMTECEHPICLSCLFELRKDECPYCRRSIFKNFPDKLKSLLKIDTSIKNTNILNINDTEQFPNLS